MKARPYSRLPFFKTDQKLTKPVGSGVGAIDKSATSFETGVVLPGIGFSTPWFDLGACHDDWE